MYSQQLVDEFCRRVIGGESMLDICGDKPAGMPSMHTIWEWENDGKHQEFAHQLQRARSARADVWAEEIQHIVDDGRNDFMERTARNGEKYVTPVPENWQRSRLRMEARLRLMAVHNRPKYGDKQHLEHSGKLDTSVSIVVFGTKGAERSVQDHDTND